MAQWEVSEPHINLWLYDEPLGYQPGLGARISFKLAYKQREARFLYDGVSGNYTGVGPAWHCSWVSYLYRNYTNDNGSPSYDGMATVVMSDGGQRVFTADGATPEYYGHGKLTHTANVDGTWATATITYPDGSKEDYAQVTTSPVVVGATEILYRTAAYDRFGNATRFYYYANNPLLHYVVDSDSRTNTLSYTGALITSVQDPFGRTATLSYDTNGYLSSVMDVQGMSSSFQYDGSGWVTNLHTPYGDTKFEYVDNGFSVSDGVIRSVKVIDAANGTNVYALFQTSGYSLQYAQWPAPVGPNTDTLFDTSSYRCSFHWGPQAAPLLPADLGDLTSDDYRRGRMKHWLHEPVIYPNGLLDYNVAYYGISQTLSMEVAPATDAYFPGLITVYDYAGKRDLDSNPSAIWLGTESQPSLVTYRLPDNTTWYKWYRRDALGRATNVVETYSTAAGQTPLLRTNIYVYSGADLISHHGPDGNLEDGYGYNAKHQLIYYTNAVGDVTTNGYDTAGRLTTTRSAAGLNTTNIYFASGWYTNFLDRVIDLEIKRTNSYTWTNDLVYTHTDERGLITTNIYDNLQRATNVLDSRGTIYYTYDKLDLVKVVDRMGFTNSFTYDNIRRKTSQTDALGRVTTFNYCSCGALSYIEDALSQQTKFFYDLAGRMTNVVYPDNYSVTNVYDPLGRIVSRTDSAGISETNWYVNQGLLYTTWNAAGQVKLLTFDNHDHVTNSVDANSVTITNTYDAIGRLLTRGYPDGGVERFGYTARGLVAYTNQVWATNFYAYDEARRKTFETNANWEVLRYTNGPAGDLVALVDGKNQVTKWNYDQYGRVTNKLDQVGTEILRYKYDASDRLTNRWSAAKGDTRYKYDPVGNLTNIDYAVSTDISFQYDPLNRMTNMVDAVGQTKYAYTLGSQLWTEDGPWNDDVVTNTYNNRLRVNLDLKQPTGLWTNQFAYDAARRLTNVTSPAGSFGYLLAELVPSTLTIRLDLPNSSYVTNIYDGNARLLSTALKKSDHTVLNSHGYLIDPANQRTQQVFNAGSTYNYSYDKIGQLKIADSATSSEDLAYKYDAAWNLNYRTNNSTVDTFTVDGKNQLTNAYTHNDHGTHVASYDGNGNLTQMNIDYSAFIETYTYDDENRLVYLVHSESYQPLNWWDSPQSDNDRYTAFQYDGLGRLRVRREYTNDTYNGGWALGAETRYVCDGWRVIQERDGNNTPVVSYTRGTDLSGSLEGAGGIGGLLGRSHGYSGGNWSTHNFYHVDGNGNITYLVDGSEGLAASYRYDPFGNMISSSGSLASDNVYRFSSKEFHAPSGLYYYGYRWYAPNLQRWLNRDPIQEQSGRMTKKKLKKQALSGWNVYSFCFNDPVWLYDIDGRSITHVASEVFRLIGFGGTCCNATRQIELWLDNGEWKQLPPGQCTSFTDDCDGLTCRGAFWSVSFGGSGQCNPNNSCTTVPGLGLPAPTLGIGVPTLPSTGINLGGGWHPGDGPDNGLSPSPWDRGARGLPSDYPWSW